LFRSSGSSMRARKLWRSSLLRVALASSQARTSLRNAASSGVSLKSIVVSLIGARTSGPHLKFHEPTRRSALRRRLRGVLLFQPGHQLVLPGQWAAERQGQHAGAAVVELGVGLPGEADAAMSLDVLLRGEVVGLGRRDARRRGG